jgi:saccharopine dehydrogenase (NAD+, L-lysine-forming)
MNWAWQVTHPGEPLPSLKYYPNEDELIAEVKKVLSEAQAKAGRLPQVIVIGALGRCGRGAVDMSLRAGIPTEQILKYDLEETKAGGPFKEIVESDIFINCIYLTHKIPNFVDMDSLRVPDRRISVICDVSADTTSPYNPVPVYNTATTFDKPTVLVEGLEGPPLSVIAIDHLPSMLPREASDAFSNDLLPSLLHLKTWREHPVWARAEKLFKEKVATLPEELQGKSA